MYKDTLCPYNLVASGSKDGLHFHRDAGNGLIRLIDKNESLDRAGEFLFCGDDRLEITDIEETLPDNWESRWSRTWKIEKYGDINAELWFSFIEAGMTLSKTREYGLLYKEKMDDEFTTLLQSGNVKFGNLVFLLQNETLKTGYYTVAQKTSDTSVPGFVIPGFEVYPNPVRDILSLKCEMNDLSAQISLVTISGQTIHNFGKQEFTGNKLRLSGLENLEPGIYILKIEHPGFVKNISVLKQ